MVTPLDTAALYDEHVDFVWRMLLRLGVDTSSVEDATQEVFLTVHRRRSEFRNASSVRTWLAGIAVRVAKDHRRGVRRNEQRVARLSSEPVLPSGDPHRRAEVAQAFAVARTLLEQLDEDQRTVLVLTEWEGLRAVEIAEIIDSNVNTVNSRLRRGREHFNELVAALRRKEAMP